MHLTDGSGHINNAFVEEDAAVGRPAAVVTAAWLNAVQAEIAAVITQDGGVLAKANNAQLAAAVLSLIGKAVTAHKSEDDPHPQYTTAVELASAMSSSLAGYVTKTGIETLSRKTLKVPVIEGVSIDKAVKVAATSGAVSLDLSAASVFDLTLSGNVTSMALANVPPLAGGELTFVVRVTQGATAYSLAWFSGLSWLTTGGTPPAAPAANKTVEYILSSLAAGVYLGRKGAET